MPSRNDPCPCGSGKRYKHCHGVPGAQAQAAAGIPGAQAQAAAGVPGAQAQAAANEPRAQSPAAHDEAAANAEAAAIASLRQRAQAAAGDAQVAMWEALLAELPADPEALFTLGNLARNAGDFTRAARRFEQAMEVIPSHAALINNLGLAYERLGRFDDAEALFRRLVDQYPTAFEPLANLAQNLFQRNRMVDALEYFDRLAEHHADIPQASIHANRAMCLMSAGRPAEADAGLAKAIALEPDLPQLKRLRAILLSKHGHYAEAAEILTSEVAARPDDLFLTSMLASCHANLGDWHDDGALAKRVDQALREAGPGNAPAVVAFDVLVRADDLALQRAAAIAWSPTQVEPPPAFERDKRRLRLGFVASEFCNQPVPRLLLGLLENLDRSDFDVITIATAAPLIDDAVVARVRMAADLHVDLFGTPSLALATARLRSLNLDVMFDLNGLTDTTATALFARRVAPMQVNFLGYTGTMASDAYDYLVADSFCIPEDMAAHYSERVLRLDPCYLPSDPSRRLAVAPPDRARYELPRDAFVIAAFSPMKKISPALFARWMEVMRKNTDSVLWLRPAPPLAAANLRRSARGLGVDPQRLIFTEIESIPDYLARFTLADLFLDTFPFGAHTTVNDALFAGLPVLALAGKSFASRASASQLAALGLAELIAHDFDEYTHTALALIADRTRLPRLRAQLGSPDVRAHLFDMRRYAANFTQLIFTGWRNLADLRNNTH